MAYGYEIIVFLISAMGIGIVGNIAGIGGGVFMMIIFLFIFRISPVIAGGLSLITIVASTVAGSAINREQGSIDGGLLYAVAIPAGTGAVIGSVASNFVTLRSFSIFFGIAVFFIGLFSYLSLRSEISRNKGSAYMKETFRDFRMKTKGGVKRDQRKGAVPVSFIAGLLSGMFGLGIGAVVGTFLTAIRHIHPKVAFSTVVAAMIATSLVGAAVHFMKFGIGISNYLLVIPLVTGSAAGGVIGAIISKNMSFSRLRTFQGYIVMFFGLLSITISILKIV